MYKCSPHSGEVHMSELNQINDLLQIISPTNSSGLGTYMYCLAYGSLTLAKLDVNSGFWQTQLVI